MDYKKLHQETLQGLKRLVLEGRISEAEAKSICSDFVADSEDERIICNIKKAAELYWSDGPLNEILSWLERQKEQKPVDYDAELKKCKDNPLYFFDKYVTVKMKQKHTEWSEEDKKMLEAIVGDIHCGADFNAEVIREANKREKWLRAALHPQSHWKPSEEQMGALNYAYCELFKRGNVDHNILGPLQTLIDTLRNL